MRLSVYNIYTLAWALAIAATVLSAVILASTFSAVKSASAATQRDTGFAQVITLNLTIATSLTRVRTEADGKLASFLLDTTGMPLEAFYPENVMDTVAPTLFQQWAPYLRHADFEIYGWLLNLLYPINASTFTFDRSLQVYGDILTNLSRMLMVSTTNNTDGLEHAREFTFVGNTPVKGPLMYTAVWFPFLELALTNDDYFLPALPWAAADGNTFWYVTYQRYFYQNQVEGTVQAMTTYYNWLETMLAICDLGTEMIIVDSNNMTIAATAAAEIARLQACHSNFSFTGPTVACVNMNTEFHPTPDIRIPFNALFQPQWNAVGSPLLPFTYGAFTMAGIPYVSVTGTTFSQNLLRLNLIWYQPTVNQAGNSAVIISVICTMTVLSTLVLTILGIFGVLKPLMRLGHALRMVTANLTDGKTDVAVERQRSIFTEVDAIGRDFETVVVDFLGFSTAKNRDTTSAPKDSTKPFVVVFTDIESSSLLWGRDATEMARCLQTHHEIIRALIQLHHMFEVKTAGDSFMVTCVSPSDAVNFAIDLQSNFFDSNWYWDGVDQLYKEIHNAFHKSAKAPDEGKVQYEDVWNGLRVRIGIHYGRGEITCDSTTKGYDYYGPVVNIASRIESAGHGGQILISLDAIKALRTPVDPSRATLKAHGVQPLRGIEKPPSLLEIVPLRFAHRTFPPLRCVQADDVSEAEVHLADPKVSSVGRASLNSGSDLERLTAAAEEIAASHSLVRSGATSAGAIAQHLMGLRETFEDLTFPLGPQVQAATLKTVCKGWGVPIPKSSAEFAVSLLLVAQRLSESAKSIARLQVVYQPSYDRLEDV